MSHNTFVNDAARKVSGAGFNTPAMTAFEQSLDKFRANPKFKVGDVTLIAVSPFGPLRKAKAGFGYMHADIEYANISNNGAAVKVPGLTLVRGGSVTVLTFLQCNGVDYVILTEQARAPIGDPEYVESPAGMLDGDEEKFVGVAAKEMGEEVGLELNGRTDFKYLGEFVPSAGGCDERIKVLFTRVKCNKAVLTYLQGHLAGAMDENEQITVRVRPLSVVRSQIRAGVLTDAKLIAGLLHYLESPELQKWACGRQLILEDGKPKMVVPAEKPSCLVSFWKWLRTIL